MSKKLEITGVYSNILENPTLLKDAGLFPPERFAELIAALDESQFEPAVLQTGRVIPGWWANKVTGNIFNEYFMSKSGKWSRNKTVLEALLTQTEIEIFNKYANELFREANEQRKFDKAQKVKADEWGGPVVNGDNYYESVDDFLGQTEEEEIPDFVWGCDDARPLLYLDTQNILENATQEAYEDFDMGDLEGVAAFEAACKEFVAKNAHLKSWWSTGKIAVLLK